MKHAYTTQLVAIWLVVIVAIIALNLPAILSAQSQSQSNDCWHPPYKLGQPADFNCQLSHTFSSTSHKG